ncbi:MAG TPA: PEP-CTERM sorting domain-containing protein [Chthoniobacterales bacterium]
MQGIYKLSNFRLSTGLSSLALIAAVPVMGWAQAADLGIETAVKQIVGSTSEFVKPHDGGSTSNTAVWNYGDYSRFILKGTDASGSPLSYGLQITAVDATGVLKPNTDSLMIAQTKSSQGLTDATTLSVYVGPDQGYGNWTLDLKFSLFDASFTTPANPSNFTLTALDLDYDQRVSISDSDFTTFTLEKTSAVSFNQPGSRTNFLGTGDGSFYNGLDSVHAVQAATNLDNEFTVTVGSGPQNPNKSLFVFDFGKVAFNNPTTYSIPEPSTALLLSIGGAMFTIMRRRRPAAKF